MFARIMTATTKPGAMDAAIKEWPDHIRAFKGKGLVVGYLFVDRKQNQIRAITIWESEEAQKRNSTSPEQVKGRAEFGKHMLELPVPSVFEVAGIVE
jgi:hypothetical protein